jgi:hypothetical protein
LLFFSTVSAQPPAIYRFEFADSRAIFCEGFDIEVDDWVTGRTTVFSDENNNPNEFVGHIGVKGTFTFVDSDTREVIQVLRDHAAYNFRGNLPWDDKDEDGHGVFFHINVPGKGVVTLVVGRAIWDADGNVIFSAGQNAGQSWDFLCEGFEGTFD